MKHRNLWNIHTSIRDNGGITVGTIVRSFAPKPYENIMPDGIPSIKSHLPEVNINDEIRGGESMEISINTSVPNRYF